MVDDSEMEAGRERRKKRAWRKPREPVTPEREEACAPKPIKLKRPERRDPSLVQQTLPPTTTITSTPPEPQAAEKESVREEGDRKSQSQLLSAPPAENQQQQGVTSAAGVGLEVGVAKQNLKEQAPPPLEIDGSIMEGGGQILRLATALGCILTRPFHISRIRGKRDKPGLRPQHLTGIELLRDMSSGSKVKGLRVGSSQVTFEPREIAGGDFVADTKTAGSICLLIQVALPVLLFAKNPSKLTLRGGTNADMAPPIDYMKMVFQPIAAKFGVHFDCQLKRRGFFPKGSGEVVVTCHPVKTALSAADLTDPGRISRVSLHAFSAGAVPHKVCQQMVTSARKMVEGYLSRAEERGVAFEEEVVHETVESAFGNSSGIIVVAETTTGCLFASSANGRKSEPAQSTGVAAGKELVRYLQDGGCVDEHLQDQLIILMALAQGTSRVRTGPLTLHTETAIHMAELLTDGKARFSVEKLKESGNIIQCEGIGFERKNM